MDFETDMKELDPPKVSYIIYSPTWDHYWGGDGQWTKEKDQARRYPNVERARNIAHGLVWTKSALAAMQYLPVEESLDDTVDMKELTPEPEIPEKDVRWWSKYARYRRFPSEAEARDWIFGRLEHWDTENWAAIFGKKGPEANRSMADHMPIYQDRWRRWRIGRPLSYYRRLELPGDAEDRQRGREVQAILAQYGHEGLQEYLSNNTSDFSDGTNGEPSAPAPFVGDTGTVGGLPDYKSIDRMREKRRKLHALIRRRAPLTHSKAAWDPNARAGMPESLEDADEIETDMKELDRQEQPVLRQEKLLPDYYHVEDPHGRFIGVVYKEVLGENPTIRSIRRIYLEFPWISQCVPSNSTTRHRSIESATDYIWRIYRGEHLRIDPDLERTMNRELRPRAPQAESVNYCE